MQWRLLTCDYLVKSKLDWCIPFWLCISTTWDKVYKMDDIWVVANVFCWNPLIFKLHRGNPWKLLEKRGVRERWDRSEFRFGKNTKFSLYLNRFVCCVRFLSYSSHTEAWGCGRGESRFWTSSTGSVVMLMQRFWGVPHGWLLYLKHCPSLIECFILEVVSLFYLFSGAKNSKTSIFNRRWSLSSLPKGTDSKLERSDCTSFTSIMRRENLIRCYLCLFSRLSVHHSAAPHPLLELGSSRSKIHAQHLFDSHSLLRVSKSIHFWEYLKKKLRTDVVLWLKFLS